MSDRLRPSSTVPRILSIAGSDPSGGAGIQADLKSIAANGGYGMAVLTALTAQNTRGVHDVHVPPVDFLCTQLDSLADDIVIDAVKIGMLATTEVIHAVTAWVNRVHPPIVVVDPVMVSTSGDRLLDANTESALRDLFAHADLITPNLLELAALTGAAPIENWSDAVERGKQLASSVGAAVLVKGGHLPGDDTPDALVEASGEVWEFTGPRTATRATHGTGCSLSSALATRRARGEDWPTAVASARSWLRESLREGEALAVGAGHGPVSHFAGLWRRGGVDTRPTAAEVEADWWEQIASVRDQIDELPFIRSLAEGTLPRESFLFYLAQDALYLHDYARLLADAARLAPTSAEQAFWAYSAHSAIAVELELHSSWLADVHDEARQTLQVREAPATTAYLDHLRATAYRGDYVELIAALLPCFWLYTDLGVRLHGGDFGAYARDPEHPYASWLATYADPDFAEATREAIEYVARGAATLDDEPRARTFRAFEVSAQHERAFFAAPMEYALEEGSDLRMPQHQR